jgi:hypothetical protein
MDKYKTIKEAIKAAISLGLNTIEKYKTGYKQDERLPANPDQHYNDDWDDFGKWDGFLGIERKDFYPTIQEASKAAITLGFKSSKEYQTSKKPNDSI